MLITLDMAGDEPIYLQLRSQIVLGIGSGELQPGDDLPTVRGLAEDVGVNPMTVNKAYTLLKEQGFIEIDRRRGAVVKVAPRAEPHFPQHWENQLTLLLAEFRARGGEKTSFIEICERLYENLNRGGEEE